MMTSPLGIGVQAAPFHDPTFWNYFVPGLGYLVTKSENVVTATGVDLFTVTGKVLITLWTMEVTEAIGGSGTSDYKIRVKTDNIDLCATGDIHGAAVKCIYQMSGDAGDSIINTASAKNTADTNGKGVANRIVGIAGGTATLQSLRTAATTTGTMIHTLYYIPLEKGARVVAA